MYETNQKNLSCLPYRNGSDGVQSDYLFTKKPNIRPYEPLSPAGNLRKRVGIH